ncbi:PSD1 and planctomycete cytochrome C domain-containing protein [Horticoccus sp. 23ND18S-11]|uniref:PSD1 and planctomycete cytochrome C domain-containing protein n=1 Tax=Horticoccus sp. 23ND18S-11 TaxID=3391832 RepID=UPI0039C981BD
MKTPFIALVLGSVAFASAATMAAGATTGAAIPREVDAPENLAFFEAKVRPLLIQHCYECHGEKKQKGGLRLDSRPGWQHGGDSGAVIVPGKPDASLLIEAVRYKNEDLQMPPKEALGTEAVAVLAEWIQRGAPDPRLSVPATGGAAIAAMSLESARTHWAFQPIVAPTLPDVPGAPADLHPIDRFIRARLAAEGLAWNSRADPRTLVRRAYLALLGLPPSFDRVEQFAADPSPAAWTALVDQLLARPEYGQRWGRHWLDVARYSDTTDKSTDSERRIPFARTYRDYVIEAFNADRPFDRFVLEQVAADRLPAEMKPDLRALGFLTVGRRFEGNLEAPELIIDDRIDTVSRGVLGLTLACARCHDHKFDAIPTTDYYSLAGILASSSEPMDLPEVGTAPVSDAVTKYRAERAALFADYAKHVDTTTTLARRLVRELAPEYLRRLVQESANHRTVEGFIPLDTPRGLLVLGGAPAWATLIAESVQRGENYFRLWSVFLDLPATDFAARARAVLDDAARHPERHDADVLAAFSATPPATMLDVAETFGRVITAALKTPDAPGLAAVINGPTSPLQFTREAVADDLLRFVTEHRIVARRDNEAAGKIREKLNILEAGAPLDRAQAVGVNGPPVTSRVLIRGDRLKPGAAVPRRIPQVLAAIDDRTYADDGRLQLAQALVSPRNPLTARVIVNRVWQQHIGQGLVATADNFGAMGERPSHPELLDHLAAWFMAHDWSFKALHRYILSSATWQQSSAVQPVAMERDAANRLLWRMAPRRLEFEALRDSLLRVAGRLDTRLGGRSAPLDDDNVRRAVYGYTDRFRIPALLRNFDMANPDQSIARRSETTHPLQALYFLNSPFVRAQAENVNRQPEIAELLDVDARIEALYRRILIRQPDRADRALARDYLGASPTDAHWIQFAQVLLLSNEFFFCD